VLLDGHDLRDLTLTGLRRHIGMVFQDTFLFDTSIRENIAFGRPEATERQICDAARAADAHDFILEFADGYETRVGQRGRSLSGGQRQRVAVARAMLRDAPLLILDEPTTGLDAESSERVLAPLSRLMRGRTTIIISHDPAVVRIAATVGVIEAGRLVEYGGADDLRAGDGTFARLFGPRAASAEPDSTSAVDSLPVLVSPVPGGGPRIGERGPAVLVAS
jgi:ABC-type multidrug transport system fused ATPase/permease subunit